MHRPILRRGAAIVAVLALAVVLAPAPASAVEGTTLTGTVVNGTHDNAPVGGVEVVLREWEGDAETRTRRTTSTDSGSFQFDGLAGGEGVTYSLKTIFQGAEYETPRAPAANGSTVEVKVHDATESRAGLAITNWVVWIDREGQGAAIQHDLDVKNPGNLTYVGATGLPDGKRSVLQFPIPEGAGNFQYLGLFMECCALLGDGSFVHTHAIAPGESRGTVRFATSSLSRIALVPPLPTDRLTVLVPNGLEVDSSRLTASGTTDDRGITYNVFTATALPEGASIDLAVGGLARAKVPLIAIVLLTVGSLSAVGLAVVRIGRALRRRDARRRREAPTAEPAAAPVVSPAAVDAPSGEVDLLMDELALLDIAFARGLVEDESYTRVRTARKARLLELLGSPQPELAEG